MAPVTEKTAKYQRFLPFISLILFLLALLVLHNTLGDVHYHHLLSQLRDVRFSQIAGAAGLTVLSYLVLTGYDHLAIAYVHHPLAAGKVTLASFISYSFSNNLGLSLLTAGSIRYRLYSSWGLSTEEIARVISFTTLTFWLGIATLGGGILVADPNSLPIAERFGIHFAIPAGLLCILITICYLLGVIFRKTPFRFHNWEIPLPSIRIAGGQLVVGVLDWTLAGSVLYVLLPAGYGLTLAQFLAIYLLAQIIALISNVPGGLGVFESVILISLQNIPPDALLGAILFYRGIYYFLPLTLAALLLGGNELFRRKAFLAMAARQADRWWGVFVPPLMAAACLMSGAILLFSGATPAAHGRLDLLATYLPLPLIELSHFLGSLVGCCLLLLARGLLRRLDAAYTLAALLLGTGSLLSLLKGADYDEALLLALLLTALLPCRRHFYRRASVFNEPFSPGWILTILLVFSSSLWLGFFAYKHVAYSSELWWQFALHGDASRFLRASVGATTLLLVAAAARLLQPAAKDPGRPEADDLNRAKSIINQSPLTLPHLALLGDKALLFDDQNLGFVMYGVEGRSWIALGDPVGPLETARSLAWKFREMVQHHGGQTVFYEVGTNMLHIYLDMGLTLFKLGEEAIVDLADFSLEGKKRSSLRYVHRRLGKEGCSFEVVPVTLVQQILPQLKSVSDDWLQEKNTREKGFSLGRFDEPYLINFPVAVVKQQEKIIAFANLWPSGANKELSIDLMRFVTEAPNSVMDYLFINLMLWGKNQGYETFNLGMAPLSGLENRSFAPLWHRIGGVVFNHGEHFYNFEGLRNYKQKFNPNWEPRYLACPGGFSFPNILINIAALISGSFKGIVSK